MKKYCQISNENLAGISLTFKSLHIGHEKSLIPANTVKLRHSPKLYGISQSLFRNYQHSPANSGNLQRSSAITAGTYQTLVEFTKDYI